MSEVYVFDTALDPYSGGGQVKRTLALRADQTLVALHRLIQEAFEWGDDHLYSFWLDGKFWGDKRSEYTAPLEVDESGVASADVAIGGLSLERGQRVAYIFDFGDEWRVSLKVREIREGGETGILEGNGDPPPQYPDYKDEE